MFIRFSKDLFSNFNVSECWSCTLYDEEEEKFSFNIWLPVVKFLTVMETDKLILYAKVFPVLSLAVTFFSSIASIRTKIFFTSELFCVDRDRLYNLE